MLSPLFFLLNGFLHYHHFGLEDLLPWGHLTFLYKKLYFIGSFNSR
jgi:hypothetical protein